MSQKKKSYPEVKDRLVIEVEKYMGSDMTAKKLSTLLKLPYTSTLLWLNREEPRPPSIELMIRLAKQFPLIDLNYIITGTITRQTGDNLLLIAQDGGETYEAQTREKRDLQDKYTKCLETNAILHEEIHRLKQSHNS